MFYWKLAFCLNKTSYQSPCTLNLEIRDFWISFRDVHFIMYPLWKYVVLYAPLLYNNGVIFYYKIILHYYYIICNKKYLAFFISNMRNSGFKYKRQIKKNGWKRLQNIVYIKMNFKKCFIVLSIANIKNIIFSEKSRFKCCS